MNVHNKMVWATIWAMFSKTHLVTLFTNAYVTVTERFKARQNLLFLMGKAQPFNQGDQIGLIFQK
jgi:hypothetical protein